MIHVYFSLHNYIDGLVLPYGLVKFKYVQLACNLHCKPVVDLNSVIRKRRAFAK